MDRRKQRELKSDWRICYNVLMYKWTENVLRMYTRRGKNCNGIEEF
jgi:hypothetical protein